VVQSSGTSNSVGKKSNVIVVIQFSQHEPSKLLSLIFWSALLQAFRVVKKHISWNSSNTSPMNDLYMALT
jgi:hypothetical protein